jgi:hypothetical protein
MSTHDHGPSHASLDDDGIDIKKILLIGGASLATFALSAVVAYFILRHDTNEYVAKGLPPKPALIGQPEIGIIDTTEFDMDDRLEKWKAAKQRRLNGYGWVDRGKSLIHIPIDKAIDQVVADSAAGSPQ